MKIITGMHRSGTSLVARLFYEAGANMGDPATLYPGDQWNPDGYYEQPAIHNLNMALIHGHWGRLAYFALPSTDTILKRSQRYADEIKAIAAAYQNRVVKECRFCLTLPAWTAQGTSVDRMLVCLRDPLAVAQSLKKRNRATQKHAYRLWVLHNERLLQHAGDIPLWFVYYDNLLDEAHFYQEVKPAFTFFGINTSETMLRALRRTCVKPHFNHSRDTAVTYPAAVQALWEELLHRHAQQKENIPDAVTNS